MNVIPSKIPLGYEQIFTEILPELRDIEQTLQEHMKKNNYSIFFPEPEKIYASLEAVPLNKVRVVLLGDFTNPYICHCGDHPRATGKSYSVNKCDITPDYLKNIFTEIKSCIPDFNDPTHGDLSSWERQGVLLLNMNLTTQPNKPRSHNTLWYGVIQKIISGIVEKRPKCIFLLWGRETEKFSPHIPNSAIKLTAESPFRKEFFGCKHFSKINEILENTGEQKIDWNL